MVSMGQPEPDPHKGFLSKVILRIIKARPDQSPFIGLSVNEVRDHFFKSVPRIGPSSFGLHQ